MLYKWHTDETTANVSVPGYIITVLVLACVTGFSNVLVYLGVCLNSRCLLSFSATLSLAIILLQVVLAGILISDPAIFSNCMCPANDAKCVETIDNLFKNAFFSLFISVLCGVEIVALCSVRCLARRTVDDSELNGISIDKGPLISYKGALGKSLLADDWEARRSEFEERSKQRLEQQRAALSSVAKKGLLVCF